MEIPESRPKDRLSGDLIDRKIASMRIPHQRIPCAMMAEATFINPATLAPRT